MSFVNKYNDMSFFLSVIPSQRKENSSSMLNKVQISCVLKYSSVDSADLRRISVLMML